MARSSCKTTTTSLANAISRLITALARSGSLVTALARSNCKTTTASPANAIRRMRALGIALPELGEALPAKLFAAAATSCVDFFFISLIPIAHINSMFFARSGGRFLGRLPTFAEFEGDGFLVIFPSRIGFVRTSASKINTVFPSGFDGNGTIIPESVVLGVV